MQEIIYGIGGYDPSKPDNNIMEVIEYPDPAQTELDTGLAKLVDLGLTPEEALAVATGVINTTFDGA